MPTPHLAASTALAATSTATTVTITSATTAGNAIIVAIDISPSWSMTVTSVTDTQGNSYSQAAGTSGTFCWVALNTTALGTSDKVTVTWSGTGSVAKNVIIMDSPGIATAQAIDPAGTTNTDSSASVSVTSGTPNQTGDLAVLVINNTNSGGAPGALGSFTAITPAIHNGSTQYLTMAYLTAGAGAVTGSASITSTLWVALLILLAPAPVQTRPGATVGADIDPNSYSGTLDQNISEWIGQVINPGRTLDSIRVFFGTNIPSSIGTSGLQRHVGVRRVLMSMKPAVSGDPSDRSRIDGFLASCAAAGLDAAVTLNHEPSPDMTAAQYIACVHYYAPTIRQYYPYAYGQAAYRTHIDASIPGAYYPGDAYVDECFYDFYEYDYRLYGVRLDSMANIADAHGKPFSCWELGVVVGGVNGTTAGAPGAATRAQGTAYMDYVTRFFAARRTAGKPTANLSYYNYINAKNNWDHVIQPGSYLAPLYDALYDAMSGAGATAPAQLAAEIAIRVPIAESLTAGSTAPPSPPPASGGQPPSATYPQLIVEAGLLPAAPVSVLGTFILDDPVYGQLDAGRLGATTAWTDITRFVRSGSVSRPSTRVQGPLLSYQAGTCSLVLDNADGRFDPDNITGPYAAGGQTLVQPMIPVRISAVFGAVQYPLFSGFADSWQDDGVNYGGRYAQVTVSATDGFKILAGQNLPAVTNPLGDSELSGARVNRILSQAGWYTDHRKVAAGDSAVQGTTLGDSPLNLLQLTADTEIGELYVDGAGSLVFRNRHAILAESRSVTPQAVFGDAPGTVHTAGTELPYLSATRADDDTTLANDVQITAVGGTMQESTSPGSIAKYLFPRSYTRSDVLLTSDAEAKSYAQWVRYVSQSTVNRVESLSVLPGRDPGHLFPQALGREIGDRIQVWRRPPTVSPAVMLFGSSSSFTPAVAGMTATGSGHTFRAQVIPGWGFGPGETSFYTLTLPDGRIVVTTVPLTGNELKPTSDHAELAVFDPVARSFQRIIIPTSAGVTTAVTPGDAVGGTDAGGGDIVLAGGKAIFTCEGYYFGWSIPTTGLYPALGFLSSAAGTWGYDAADSLTGDQYHNTNATLFTSVINATQATGNGANYWAMRGAGQMAVLPQSGNVVLCHYFNGNGFNSGALSVFTPAGALVAAYQIPSMNRQDGVTSILMCPREVKADPSSAANDERFLVIYDVFANGNANPSPAHVIQEFAYNAGTQTITPKSVPCIPGDDDAQTVFSVCAADGTLYVSNIGISNGLATRNTAVYLKKAGERNLVTAAPATTTWATDGRFATQVAADWSLGFAQAQALWLGGPMAVDTAATGAVLVPAATGFLGAVIPDPDVTTAGPQLLSPLEGTMEAANVLQGDDELFTATTGTWLPVSGATLAQGTPPVAPPPNAVHAAKATSTSAAVMVLESGFYPATPGATYLPMASFLADSVGGVNCILWLNWYDSAQSLISSSATNTISNNTVTWTTTSATNTLIAPAGTAWLKAEVQISTGVTGRIHWFTDVLVRNVNSGWTPFVTGTLRSPVLARSGLMSLALTAPFTQTTLQATSPAFTVQPGREYRAAGWFRAGSGVPTGTCVITYSWFDAAGNPVTAPVSGAVVSPADSTSAWTQALACYPAPQGAATGQLTVKVTTGSSMTAGQSHYLDDVTVTAMPYRTVPAAELGLAALAAGGLTFGLGPGRPSISGRVLYVPLGATFTTAEQAAWSQATYVPDSAHPSFLAGVDLTQFLGGTQAAGAVVKDCFVRGIQHDFDASARTWATTWTLQDAGRYGGFFVLDSPTQGVLDSNILGY